MSKQFPHPFGKLAKLYREMRRKLPAEISNIALNEFKENFRRQGYRNKGGITIPWRSTKKKKNTFGGGSKGVLIKSGRLKRSLRAMPDYNTARVVTNVPYAEIHNEGGVINGTQNVRAHPRKGTKGVKAFTRTVNTKMPRRSFMISTQPLIDDIAKHIDGRLGEIWDKA